MLTHALLSLLIFSYGFTQIRSGLFEFFYFCFVSDKYYSKLMLLNFTLSEDVFSL